MDWKLIFSLSMFGLAMALATVFVIPWKIEPVCWLAVFVICAIIIARQRPDRHFLHGFMVSVVNSVWITAAHIIFFARYMAGHPREAAMSSSMSSPRLMMALFGPLFGVAFGIILGLFAFVAGKITGRRSAASA
jgi:hypothetical protein